MEETPSECLQCDSRNHLRFSVEAPSTPGPGAACSPFAQTDVYCQEEAVERVELMPSVTQMSLMASPCHL